MSDSQFPLVSRVAIVTGSAHGIGLAIAKILYDQGASVVLTDLEQKNIEPALSYFSDQHRVRSFSGDLSLEKNANSLIRQTIEDFGRIDILVNNAGGGVILPFLEHTPETLKQTIDRNLWTAIWCNRAVLPQMQQQQYGRIIHIGADSVRNGLIDHAAYNAAKGGVHGLTTGLAREFSRQGITVNTVAPCAVRTEEYDRVEKIKPELIAAVVSVIPMGRPGECDEIAEMVAYLSGEKAAFVTGQVLSINGGSTML